MQTISIDLHKSALLVIDVQHGLFQWSTRIYKAGELLANIHLLVERAHQAGIPIFYFQHSGDPALPEGSPGWQLHPSLEPKTADTLIIKQEGNAFLGTDLDQALKSKGINTLVVTGLLTHACVKATCLGARSLKYNVVLVEDGHSNYSKDAPRLIDKWNQNLEGQGCILKSASEVQFE